MITAENIHDALTLLPDDLIAPVDALRRKKRIPWRSLTAAAACLCLCAGLYFFILPGAVEKNAAGMATESAPLIQTAEVIIYSVGEDYLQIAPKPNNNFATEDNLFASMASVIVTFENLQTVPDLKPGQKIRIYYTEVANNGMTIKPFRIQILDD